MTFTHGSRSIYWIFFLFLIAMTAWMFWQQSRQQKGRRQLQSNIQVGDRVVTIGGVIGVVREVRSNNQVVLAISDNVEILILKSAVGNKYQEPQ